MLVFRKILRTYEMNDPLLLTSVYQLQLFVIQESTEAATGGVL